MIDMKDPMVREAVALRLAKLAQEFVSVRAELNDAAHVPYDCGRTLATLERSASESLDLYADEVQRALITLASRLDRDLASKL